MIVSFASKDGIHVNEHFGWCQCFYKYSIDEKSFTFLSSIDSNEKKEEEGEKLNYKIECLGESHIVCVTQVGPKAASMVQSAGIYPMKCKEGEKIEDVLRSLQLQLSSNTPLWLKRISIKADS